MAFSCSLSILLAILRAETSSSTPVSITPYTELNKIDYTYGGDYNSYDPSDNNFNCNGIIGPDRQLNPHAYEIAHEYQNIWATESDLKTGKIKIYNENFFRDLKNYKLVWKLLVDGKVAQNGEVADLNVEPQRTAEIILPYRLNNILSLSGRIAGNLFSDGILLHCSRVFLAFALQK